MKKLRVAAEGECAMREFFNMFSVTIVIMGMIILYGCSDDGPSSEEVVRTVSGGSQIDSYNKTKAKIKDIGADIQERYEQTN